MSVDFPRAWQICKSVAKEYHHNDCSYNQTSCVLCDCDILMKHEETTSDVFYGKDGIPIQSVEGK